MRSDVEIQIIERNRIVQHIRGTGEYILAKAMTDPGLDLERAEIICTILEDVAESIEENDHWSHVN
jgi:hypothetical protein